MNYIYTATTCRFDSQGEKSEDVQNFSKDRSGLRQAYKFVQGTDEWIIWCGDEMVDYSK